MIRESHLLVRSLVCLGKPRSRKAVSAPRGISGQISLERHPRRPCLDSRESKILNSCPGSWIWRRYPTTSSRGKQCVFRHAFGKRNNVEPVSEDHRQGRAKSPTKNLRMMKEKLGDLLDSTWVRYPRLRAQATKKRTKLIRSRPFVLAFA